ncbi:uncharacterized protein LOC133377965 [Rhineura floridana]|uniref:uncharacterized protein LOC133377965 n=1 Tax=Rhineura floridana TaxID=261503 RepID=UPI002AC7EA39|nr:uncharacterized protein LOC133377965 [Rhineura floridana]XP_061468746.1 uncharacterized protein LOC133377965 [Rhineura floridana]XP_061468753.1 uncharacterized protein LOC133377965 [Rhineura floridana]
MMPRGRAWTQQEIGCLLALIRGCREVMLLMASTSRPNEALWREISRKLAAAGYSRSVAQCRCKWKALKQAFYSEWETRQQGSCHSPRVPPHYKNMEKIWKVAGRPVFGERCLPDLGEPPPHKNRRNSEASPSPSSTQPQGAACSRDSSSERQRSLVPLAGNQPLPVRAQEDSPENAEEKQMAMGEQASASGVQVPSMVSLLQSMQQILVQILCTSQQHQLLLESLASDTVSHLHVISDNLAQVGETLQELLVQSHGHSAATFADPYSLHTPICESTSQPCSPGIPPGSPYLKAAAASLLDLGFHPHRLVLR